LNDLKNVTTETLLELRLAQDDLARAQGVYDRIAERITIAQTEQNAPDRVRLRKRAEPPEVGTRAWKTIIAACGASFCLPFVVAGFCSIRQRRPSRRPARLEPASPPEQQQDHG